VEQTECLKSWIRKVVKLGGFTTADIALNVEAIKKGLDQAQDNDLGNNKAVDKAADEDSEYKRTLEGYCRLPNAEIRQTRGIKYFGETSEALYYTKNPTNSYIR